MRVEELDGGVQSPSQHRLWQESSFGRAHQGVAQVGVYSEFGRLHRGTSIQLEGRHRAEEVELRSSGSWEVEQGPRSMVWVEVDILLVQTGEVLAEKVISRRGAHRIILPSIIREVNA